MRKVYDKRLLRRWPEASPWQVMGGLGLVAVVWLSAPFGATSPAAAAPLPLPTQGHGGLGFEDIAGAAGLDFVHSAGMSPAKHVPETMGSGGLWMDFDADGMWDLYLIDAGAVPGSTSPTTASDGANVMYRALPGGRFERAPHTNTADPGYGMGATVADYDNDGWVDLFVTNYGANVLYRNNGDGTFSNVTEAFGVGDERWGVSAAWGDLDADGFNELLVSNYLVYSPVDPPVCGSMEVHMYCPPQMFDGVDDILYRNDGGARLVDISREAGIANGAEGKGLGVIMADIDLDGMLDIYIANDQTRNFLYRNQGGLRFDDQGLFSGAGLSETGQPQSGMGVDIGDLDGDGTVEIGVTNFYLEPVNLFKTVGAGLYMDESYTMGMGESTVQTLGFGLVFADLDGDTDRDIMIANGHILDTHEFFAQPNQVFINLSAEQRAGTELGTQLLREVTEPAGPAVSDPRVSRGLSIGDVNHDGVPDLLVTTCDGPAQLLLNTTRSSNRRLVVRLRGRTGNRDALGARVTVSSADATGQPVEQRFEVKSASSYLSQSATDLYIGVGGAAAVNLEIRWPNGATERFEDISSQQLVLIQESRGIVATTPIGSR